MRNEREASLLHAHEPRLEQNYCAPDCSLKQGTFRDFFSRTERAKVPFILNLFTYDKLVQFIRLHYRKEISVPAPLLLRHFSVDIKVCINVQTARASTTLPTSWRHCPRISGRRSTLATLQAPIISFITKARVALFTDEIVLEKFSSKISFYSAFLP